jgi:hypothetical protein
MGSGRSIPVLSDECYISSRTAHTILEHGSDGVLAVHSLSKRSNPPVSAGFAGDPALVRYLSEVRKHAGASPRAVAAAVVAWADDPRLRRDRYWAPGRGQGARASVGHRCRRSLLPLGPGAERRRMGSPGGSPRAPGARVAVVQPVSGSCSSHGA